MEEVHIAYTSPPHETQIAGTGRSGLKIVSARPYQATAFISMRQLTPAQRAAGAQIASMNFDSGGRIFTINITNHTEIYEFKN